ncbi:transmembrane protein, putative [Medicago truncatula]|uniref:Transmembrane protein, putative n=1 Tax=Medicago truncatula TaxID=3880 RepID=G7JKR9_MEDTR|nr:transmembrane protein, putative [Medicago truncatula]
MNQTRKQIESSPSFIIITTGIFNLIINTVVHHHHRTGMPKLFCCGNSFCELYSKPILLWKWFPESSISSSTLSFIIITVPECQNHFAVEMVSVSCTPNPFCCGMVSRIFNLIINIVVHHHHRQRTGMPKPFCCGKPLDVLNGFHYGENHEPESTVPPPNLEPSQPTSKLPKNTKKKLARQHRWEAKKAEKKAATKEQKKKEIERKRKEWEQS